MTLEELLERVEAAEGANFQLEVNLCTVLEPQRLDWARNQGFQLKPPNYTYSCDAALALLEAKLPGMPWSLRWDGEWTRAGVGTIASAQHHKRPDKEAALALIAALLKALIAQQNKD